MMTFFSSFVLSLLFFFFFCGKISVDCLAISVSCKQKIKDVNVYLIGFIYHTEALLAKRGR